MAVRICSPRPTAGSAPNTNGRNPPASSRPARIGAASPGGYSRAGSPTATQPIGILVSGGTTQPMWTAPPRATLLARPIRAPLKTMAPVAMNISRYLISIRLLCPIEPKDLAGLPDLLARPLPGPLDGGQRVRCDGTGAGPELEEVLDLKPAAAEQPDHVAVAEVELDRVVVGPFEPVHAEVRPEQPVRGGQVVLVGDREHDHHRVDQEDQLAARAQQPGRLGDPGVRVAPDAGAVLADGQVEAGVGERRPLGIRVEEREPQPEALLQLARGRQLRRRVVQGHRPGAAARQPGRDVAGTAAELNGVEA